MMVKSYYLNGYATFCCNIFYTANFVKIKKNRKTNFKNYVIIMYSFGKYYGIEKI